MFETCGYTLRMVRQLWLGFCRFSQRRRGGITKGLRMIIRG